MLQMLRTNVSKAYWFNPKETKFQSAEIPRMHTPESTPEAICWLDKLLEGGIFLPQQPFGSKTRAVTTLITGPPGSGKSTLALELCYRLTYSGQIDGEDIHSLYITSESDENWLIEKAKSFNWPEVKRVFAKYEPHRPQNAIATVWQTKDFREYLQRPDQIPQPFYRNIFIQLARLNRATEDIPQIFYEIFDELRIRNNIIERAPHLLVIDSLNTVEPYERPEIFQKFVGLTTCGPKLIIFIIDSEGPDRNEFWEFLCDNVIRLDRIYKSDYMIRTIEIVKARYQSHIWGKHQLKIYTPLRTKEEDRQDFRRAHPFREEGGIFIFPSIHYYLSSYKRRTASTVPEMVPTHLPNLNEILGGFPGGRCTGFIGCRGGHKSHLGYLHVLTRVINNRNEKGLIISLRDDEGMARKTMTGIIQQEFPKFNDPKKAESKLSDLEKDDKLEIIYYPPGYITPEEFFHRIFLSIHRMKYRIPETRNQETPVRLSLLFNSLDQLSSRFPLCAKEDIFVPGIIETLSAEEVTSFFIAVEEPGQPEEQYGLLSMADVIINFSPKLFKKDHYCGHLNETLPEEKRVKEKALEKIKHGLGDDHRTIVLQVVRYAGGQAAGAGGILELVNTRHPAYDIYKLYNPEKIEGLYFTPFSPQYPPGENLQRINFSLSAQHNITSGACLVKPYP